METTLTVKVILGALSVAVTLLSTAVARLWFNHLNHIDEKFEKVDDRFDSLEHKVEAAHSECKVVIERETVKCKADIRQLFDLDRKKGERLAAVEARCQELRRPT